MKTVSPAIETAFAADAAIGESPIWSPERKRLLWIDIIGQKLHAYDPASGHNETLEVPDVIGALAEDRSGTLTLGLGCDLARLTPAGKVERIARAPHAAPGYRFNDSKYDREGRLWIGLMDKQRRPGSGILYRYDPDGSWHIGDNEFSLPNGLDWSQDGLTFYFTDSYQGDIYAYDFDPKSGEISNRRLLIHISPNDGRPDGLTVDAEGYLLSVLFDGAAILRMSPAGHIDRKIELPVPRPTSCVFAGDNRHLFITTARIGLTSEDLRHMPASGALLQLDYEEALN